MADSEALEEVPETHYMSVTTTKVQLCFDVEYICGFVRWGGMQTKSMTSQRAANKMAAMRIMSLTLRLLMSYIYICV